MIDRRSPPASLDATLALLRDAAPRAPEPRAGARVHRAAHEAFAAAHGERAARVAAASATLFARWALPAILAFAVYGYVDHALRAVGAIFR